MEEYIEFPDYIDNVEEIHSNNLKNFFAHSEIYENKISLTSLRTLYMENKQLFFDVVDELAIRGFRFTVKKSNNLLPNVVFHSREYIKVVDDQRRFALINFNLFGIGNFIQRFKIDSDLFFNKIPVDALAYLNKHMDLEGLEEELSNVGFDIVKSNNDDKENVSEIIEDDLPEEDRSHEEPKENYNTDNNIDVLFSENTFKSFRIFCEGSNISGIRDITSEVLESYSKMRSVGAGKVQQVKERVEAILNGSYHIEMDDQEPEYFYHGYVSIADVFTLRKYQMFVEYCLSRDVTAVKDVTVNILNDFRNQPRVGRKKYEEVKAVLDEYKLSQKDINDFVFTAGELYPYIKDRKINEILKCFGYKSVFHNEYVVSEVEGRKLEQIGIEDADLVLLSRTLVKQQSVRSIIQKLTEIIPATKFQVLKSRLVDKKTLEEIGGDIGVTRERVRQMEKSVVNDAIAYFKQEKLFTILELITDSDQYIAEKDVKYLFDDMADIGIELLKVKASPYVYNKALNIFIISNKLEQQLNELEFYIKELPSYFHYKEIGDLTENFYDLGFEEYSEELAEKYLLSHGAKQYGDYYCLGSLRITDVLTIIFKNHIKHPVRLDDEGLKYIADLAEKYLCYKLDADSRQIEARVRDIENIILVNRLTFQWFDEKSIDSSIIDEIDNFLEQRFEVMQVVNAAEIFEVFKDSVIAFGIENKIHLYSVIKYFLSEEYDIGSGNTLNIYKKDEKRINTEEVLINVIRDLGGICTKSDIEKEIKWPRYKIDLTISNSFKIIGWGKNQVIIIEYLKLTEGQKEALLDLIKNCFSKGYSTASLVFDELKFNKSLAVLIGEKKLDNPIKLAGLLKTLNPDLRGHTNFLYFKDCPITSMEELVASYFQEPVTRRELRDFIMSYGYKDLMPFNIEKNLLETGKLIEVSRDELLPANKFSLTSEEISIVKNYIQDQIGDKEYLCLSKLTGYKFKLPAIEYPWNGHLLKTVLSQHGYKPINKEHGDYRYNEPIVVTEQSSISSFSELVYTILRDEYKGQWHEIAIYDFLADKGIVRPQTVDVKKVLPYEIKHNTSLFNIDELGFVNLKG